MKNEGLNKLGSLVDGAGEPIVEMFSAPNALTKGADEVARGIYVLSETVIRAFKPDHIGGFLGGEFGYGTDYENDVFYLRYDRQDWDCTCGFSEEAQKWHKENPHAPECYYARYNAADKQWDIDHANDEWSAAYRAKNAWRDQFAKALCRELNIPWNKGYVSAVHCTCGKDKKGSEWFSAHDHKKPCEGYWSGKPNFFYKKSGFGVTWYKWIGRDMEPTREISVGEWVSIWKECWKSIPEEAREKAQKEHDEQERRENDPEWNRAQELQMAAMWAIMSKPSENSAPRPHVKCEKCGKEEDLEPQWGTPIWWACDECRVKPRKWRE